MRVIVDFYEARPIGVTLLTTTSGPKVAPLLVDFRSLISLGLTMPVG